MKTFVEKKLVIILFSLIVVLFSKEVPAQHVVSVQVFYDELSPYGQWVNYPNYGYVWIPFVGHDFFPYSTKGHWEYTYYGWTWVSDYNWGWAPFHYGRWDYDPYYGWFWIPGIEWGPAWVIWRRCPGYYGWGPLKPGHNHTNSSDQTYYGPRENWVFIDEKHMGRKNMYNYYAPRTNNETLLNNSTVIDNTYIDKERNVIYITGPGKEDVEKNTGIRVKPLAIEESSKPMQSVTNDRLSIYRPTITKTSENEPKPAPAKLVDLKEVRPASERIQLVDPKPVPARDNDLKPLERPSQQKKEAQPRIIQHEPAQPRKQEAVPKSDPPKPQNVPQPKRINPQMQQPPSKPITNQPKQQPDNIKELPAEKTKPHNLAPQKRPN